MTDFVLPIWLFIVLTALPSCLCLLVLIFRMTRKRRQPKDEITNQPIVTSAPGPILDNEFQNDLNALQIDAVFNAMISLIETERIKLKNLICTGVPCKSNPPVERYDSDMQVNDDDHSCGINQLISEQAASGESIGAIAKSLGISRSEVELAMSMTSKPENARRGRLEAVA